MEDRDDLAFQFDALTDDGTNLNLQLEDQDFDFIFNDDDNESISSLGSTESTSALTAPADRFEKCERGQRIKEDRIAKQAKKDAKLAAAKEAKTERQAKVLEKKEERRLLRGQKTLGKAPPKATKANKSEKRKLTYVQAFAEKAKGRIADEMLVRYDVYVEKERLYQVEDPSLPWVFRSSARGAWRILAPHFRNEFVSILESEIGLRKKRRFSIEHRNRRGFSEVAAKNCRHYVDLVRSRILYALYPYDKSLWRAMEDPLWWVLFLVRCFPMFGISSLAFAALLCLVDRHDQFQLIQFILIFKKFQFLVSGVCGLLYFSAWYSFCVVLEQPKYTKTCGYGGPGSYALGAIDASLVSFPILIGFVAQIALVWVALYLMRFSVPKGGTVRGGVRLINDVIQWKEYIKKAETEGDTIKDFDLPVETPNRKRTIKRTGKVIAFNRKTCEHTICMGNDEDDVVLDLHSVRYFVVDEQGPLQHLLHYDLFCFFFVCVIALLLLGLSHFNGDMNHGWQLRAVLLGMQVGYSLCAFPFVFASIEPWKWVFTHARETGYNEMGECVTRMERSEFPWVRDAVVVLPSKQPQQKCEGNKEAADFPRRHTTKEGDGSKVAIANGPRRHTTGEEFRHKIASMGAALKYPSKVQPRQNVGLSKNQEGKENPELVENSANGTAKSALPGRAFGPRLSSRYHSSPDNAPALSPKIAVTEETSLSSSHSTSTPPKPPPSQPNPSEMFTPPQPERRAPAVARGSRFLPRRSKPRSPSKQDKEAASISPTPQSQSITIPRRPSDTLSRSQSTPPEISLPEPEGKAPKAIPRGSRFLPRRTKTKLDKPLGSHRSATRSLSPTSSPPHSTTIPRSPPDRSQSTPPEISLPEPEGKAPKAVQRGSRFLPRRTKSKLDKPLGSLIV